MLTRWFDFLLGVPLLWLISLVRLRQPAVRDFRKILVIKLAAMGDTVLLIPVLHSLRGAHPDATIHWLMSRVNAPVARTVPYVNETIAWNGFSPMHFLTLIQQLRRERYDAVIDFEQWARGTALISFFCGAPHRVGFTTPGQFRSSLFTESVEKTFRVHELDDFYALAAKLGTLERQPTLEIFETEKGKDEIGALLSDTLQRNKLNVLIHPGCGADGLPREWPLSKYAEVSQWLEKTFDAQIFASGGPEETQKTAGLARLTGGNVIDLGGKLSWEGVISLVRHVDLIISGNTGVMHIAAALQKKQLALHGPTNALLWGPVNPNAVVVRSSCPGCPSLRLGFEYHRRDQFCMNLIEVDEVKASLSQMLS
ncbi:MAG: glycosyltransferase family 9 protein [Ignavibacteriae bacterium]|nr:glycosyltransferase family 9 protein [Ignavibacteriota bacterium]